MGKTTLISGIAKGMGLTCNVSSPTFAIVNVYGEHNEYISRNWRMVDVYKRQIHIVAPHLRNATTW